MTGGSSDDEADGEASAESGPDVRVLPRALRGQYARSQAAWLLSASPARELVLDCRQVLQVDAFGAVILRAAIDSHLATAPTNTVTIVEPTDPVAWQALYDLLARELLPSRSSWSGQKQIPQRGADVVIPVLPVATDLDAQTFVEEGLPRIGSRLGHPRRRLRIAQEAAEAFVENARTHGGSSPLHPLLCVTLDPVSHLLQVVVLDQAPGWPSGDGENVLRNAVSRGAANYGSLAALAAERFDGASFSLRLRWGTGSATLDTLHRGRGWAFRDADSAVPGFVAALELRC